MPVWNFEIRISNFSALAVARNVSFSRDRPQKGHADCYMVYMVFMARARHSSLIPKRVPVLLLFLAAAFFSDTTWATTQDVWIAVRTDGQPGTGTQADPYDGSTPEKFDALMQGFATTQDLGIHLTGTDPFPTYATHSWFVRSGWVISGDGMDTTTVKMVGNVAGIHHGISCFVSDPSRVTDNVTIKDMTIDCNWAELSLTADPANGEYNIKTGAVALWGSNNLVDHVRGINGYGSLANLQEQFLFYLARPGSGDGTNDVIQSCRAEQPQGNYATPFSLAGSIDSPPDNHFLRNSRVVGCTAIGVTSDLPIGFTSGVGFGNAKNCRIDGNTFIDCLGAAYIDVGSCEGVSITNNTVVRGWMGVGLRNWASPKRKIEISGNTIGIRPRAGLGVGIFVSPEQPTTDLAIRDNTITCESVSGTPQFWGIAVESVNTALISNNVISLPSFAFGNWVVGTNIILSHNRQPDGSPVPGL